MKLLPWFQPTLGHTSFLFPPSQTRRALKKHSNKSREIWLRGLHAKLSRRFRAAAIRFQVSFDVIVVTGATWKCKGEIIEKRGLSNIQHDQLFSCSGTFSINSTASLICIVYYDFFETLGLGLRKTAEFKEERKERVNRLKGTETGSTRALDA